MDFMAKTGTKKSQIMVILGMRFSHEKNVRKRTC